MSADGYKSGQLVGKQGLEKQYEKMLHGREGIQFVEVDAHNRVVTNGRAREAVTPQEGPPLYTNIDLDLQEYIHSLFGDSLAAAAVAMVPQTGEVLALYSSPALDPNRWVGGVSQSYYDSLRTDPRQPLYNKALQAIAAAGIDVQAGDGDDGARGQPHQLRLRTCRSRARASTTSATGPGTAGRRKDTAASTCSARSRSRATCTSIKLGQRLTLSRLVGGGVGLGFDKRTGIDLPEESQAEISRRATRTTSTSGTGRAAGRAARRN